MERRPSLRSLRVSLASSFWPWPGHTRGLLTGACPRAHADSVRSQNTQKKGIEPPQQLFVCFILSRCTSPRQNQQLYNWPVIFNAWKITEGIRGYCSNPLLILLRNIFKTHFFFFFLTHWGSFQGNIHTLSLLREESGELHSELPCLGGQEVLSSCPESEGWVGCVKVSKAGAPSPGIPAWMSEETGLQFFPCHLLWWLSHR